MPVVNACFCCGHDSSLPLQATYAFVSALLSYADMSFSCKTTGAGSPSSEKVGASYEEKREFTVVQREFTYVKQFLQSKGWEGVNKTGVNEDDWYFMTGEMFQKKKENGKQKRLAAKHKKDLPSVLHTKYIKLGKQGKDYIKTEEEGVKMVCDGNSAMKEEYFLFCRERLIV